MKKNLEFYFIIFFFLILVDAVPILAQNFSESNLKVSEKWEKVDRPLYNPFQIASFGNYLIVIDDADDEKILIFDKESRELVQILGREGKGPGEYLSPWNIFTSNDGKESFCIYDLQLRRISCYKLASVINESNDLPSFTLTLSGDSGLPLRVTGIPETLKFIITGIFQKPYRFLMIDKEGKEIQISDEIDHKKGKEPLNVFQHAYTVSPTINTNADKIALAYFYTSTLEIYSIRGEQIISSKAPGDFFNPLFSVRQTPQGPTMAQGGETKLAYVDINSTSNLIYALYSGRTRSQRRAGHSNTIHVFDWDGTLQSIMHLDRDVIDCTIEEDDNQLFCIDKSGIEPIIVAYKINR